MQYAQAYRAEGKGEDRPDDEERFSQLHRHHP